jgi:SAM-dependent methyltransferase
VSAPVPPPPIRGLRGRAARLFEQAAALNVENIELALRGAAPTETLLDLGCDDGALTLRLAAAAGAQRIVGVEMVAERADLAAGRGIEVHVASLNDPLPLEDASVGLVVSNQVIEHLADTDGFVREIHRVLRVGGKAVVSTENLASWHNIGALVFGWQPFSLTNVSSQSAGLGNPLAVHRGDSFAKAWEHLRVFAYQGLRELFELHSFVVEDIQGAGYYPLPATVGRRMPRHAAFLTVVARRA